MDQYMDKIDDKLVSLAQLRNEILAAKGEMSFRKISKQVKTLGYKTDVCLSGGIYCYGIRNIKQKDLTKGILLSFDGLASTPTD
jgi:hypothetical protein